jgi:hypothetical protein
MFQLKKRLPRRQRAERRLATTSIYEMYGRELKMRFFAPGVYPELDEGVAHNDITIKVAGFLNTYFGFYL